MVSTELTTLPPEIIAEVFGAMAQDAHAAYIRSYKREALTLDSEDARPYSWIRVSHVCRVWRSIALSTPALWANLCIIGPIATKEFLSRSASQRLTVTFRRSCSLLVHTAKEDEDRRMDLYTNIICNHIQRITSLIVPAHFEILTSEVAQAATQLHTIMMIDLDHNRAMNDADALPLPFPALKQFEFWSQSSVRRRYSRLLCPTLKTLVIFGLPLTAHELVRAIATMPDLEHLDIHLASIRGAIMQTANLPHVRSICLAGASATIANLFSHIIIPCDAQRTIDCRVRSAAAIHIDTVLSVPRIIARVLDDRVDPSSFAPCATFSIGEIPNGFYAMHGWRRAPNVADFASSAALDVSADICVRCAWEETYEDLAPLLLPFTLAVVEHVRIGRMPWFLGDLLECTSTLCSHSGLKSLVLDGTSVTHALYLLADTSASRVTLMNIKFHPSSPETETQGLQLFESTVRFGLFSDPGYAAPSDPGFAADFANVLAKRAAEGRPIISLRILLAMNLVAADVETLKEHVTELEWDGIKVIDPTIYV